jgi:serine/threonine protein kinase
VGLGEQSDPDRSDAGTPIRGDAGDGPDPGETLPVRVTLPGEGDASGLNVKAIEGGPVHPVRNLVGRRVGSYLVTRYIQHGGMGEVWEAVQESPRRPVALKLMRGGRSDEGARRRFTDEAEIIARLRHPNIAHVYGAGYFEDPDTGQPEPYFAMLFVPGARSLTRYAFDEGLGTEARLRLFADVCDALAHAHAKGVVHRDLKPSNVLVGEDGRPYVIDFGIAQAAAHVLPRARRTESGQVIGTPAYLSPEQTLGDPGAVDHRADVYALGVILYELIGGRHPLNLERFGTPETLRAVRRGDIIDPSRFVPDLDADLRGIMLWALARRREDRPPSAGALREEIVRYLECRPRADGHLTWVQRGRSCVVTMARRHPVATRAVLPIVLGISLQTLPSDPLSVHSVLMTCTAGAIGGLAGWLVGRGRPAVAMAVGCILAVVTACVLWDAQPGAALNPLRAALALGVCAIVSAGLPVQRFPFPAPLPGVAPARVSVDADRGAVCAGACRW